MRKQGWRLQQGSALILRKFATCHSVIAREGGRSSTRGV